MIKKADILLLIAIIIFGSIVSYFSVSQKTEGDTVVVSVDGEIYGTYELNKDQEIVIKNNDHINHIIIKDGYVQMSSSTCKNQICVEQGKIHTTGKQIACLPNKVLIEIKSNSGGDVDVISG